MIVDTIDSLEKSNNLVIYNNRSLYIERREVDLFGNIGYAYVICDVKRKGEEVNKYLITAREDKLEDSQIDN
ncbi:hypothetical protein AGMMS49992_16420 [Clostridia bacterium]|nr:hypothetical protein AGMMS49992_16420 [Clostridia bacterium]